MFLVLPADELQIAIINKYTDANVILKCVFLFSLPSNIKYL